ncbi:hypothetical protein SAMN05216252_107226 [Actinacidiphila glaucinigra]|uniref:Uncharacterized protein n=1 Tax=Actinacidiphila glaucinigra TaxID=235986 RepID=A0A239G5U3_9ACTN|nr:hypothetical protein SAMN05216252_107226 [Actinacidiphila glaucinigra]
MSFAAGSRTPHVPPADGGQGLTPAVENAPGGPAEPVSHAGQLTRRGMLPGDADPDEAARALIGSGRPGADASPRRAGVNADETPPN